MRQIIPENRLRVYDVREIIETLADTGWVLELRREFGRGMVTSLIRVEGRPVGVIANNPRFLGGAIDSDGADKAARFMQLCDAFDIPLLFLCDTPGIMVGPEIEKTALVRHSSRMFVIGANLTRAVLHHRAAQGVRARRASRWPAARSSAGLRPSRGRPASSAAWGSKARSSSAIATSSRRSRIPRSAAASTRRWSRSLYEHGKALNIASLFGVDDTIDPAESRLWLANLLRSLRPAPRGPGKRRSAIDAW